MPLTTLKLLRTSQTPETSPALPLGGHDVFALAGQSNTHFGRGLDPAIDVFPERTDQLGRQSGNRQVLPAVEPLDHPTVKPDSIGFATGFVRRYVEAGHLTANRRVLLVPCGAGGTGFVDGHWRADGARYADLADRLRFALTLPGARLMGVLWHQGEKDVTNPDYQEELDALIARLRADLDRPNLPFVLGGMVPLWVASSAERQATQRVIAATPSRVRFTGYADPSRPYELTPIFDDRTHYSAGSQRAFGPRYFEAWLDARRNDRPTLRHRLPLDRDFFDRAGGVIGEPSGYALVGDDERGTVAASDGPAARIDLPGARLGPSYTKALWVRLGGHEGGSQNLLSTDDGYDHLLFVAGNRRVRAGHASFNALQAERPLELGRWHHVAATYDAATRRLALYLDGAPMGAVDSDPVGSSGLVVGNWASEGAGLLAGGALSEVRVYDRAMTPDEVVALAAETALIAAAPA